jgi:protein-disulfide isomerase
MKQIPGSSLWLIATLATVLATTPPLVAQTSPEIQLLRKEIETLKQRQDALQKEVAALKGQIAAAPAASGAAAVSNVSLTLDRAAIRGNPSARVVLVEISDFECPFCGRHFRQTAPLIDKDYIATGKIRYAFINLPLSMHRNAFKAAEAGACAADQGKFWEMHDRLFANQSQLVAPMLPTHAAAIGVNADQFRACLDGSRHAEDVRKDVALAQSAGATATPTFLVGTLDPKTSTLTVTNRIIGAKSYAVFQQTLDAALAKK